MTETVTQWAARVLALLPCPPPERKHGQPRPIGSRCWLCGGPAGATPWLQAAAIAPTFTQHNTAAVNDSDSVCQSCAALTQAATYQAMVKARALPLKLWSQAGWHSYSHHIRDDGSYEAPVPGRMRDILLDPPAGRWLLTLNTTGKKHTIFRAQVATGRAHFPVQVDEETVWVEHAELLACLAAWEHLAALGCGKDGIETGDYHPADTMRAGIALWRPAELAMAPWRATHPALVGLVRVIARSAKTIAEAGQNIARDAAAPAIAAPPPARGPQQDLFA